MTHKLKMAFQHECHDTCVWGNQELLMDAVSPLWNLRVTEDVQEVDGDGILYSTVGYYISGLMHSTSFLTVSLHGFNFSHFY